MSANYHSFRNIGFRFVEAEAICGKWRAAFTGFNPETAVRVLNLERDAEYVYVRYFEQSYRLKLANGILEKRMDTAQGTETAKGTGERPQAITCPKTQWTEDLFMNEAMVIYHLLGDVKEYAHLSGIWVPEPDLDPVKIRSGNRTDPLVGGFAAEFSGRIEELDLACERLGGIRIARGDTAWQIRAMDPLPMQLIFWDQDEEFPAQVQVLVDERITDYMHFEAAGCMIADLFEKIGKAAGGDIKTI